MYKVLILDKVLTFETLFKTFYGLFLTLGKLLK